MKYVIPSGLMDALPKNKTYSKFEACFDILSMADDNGRLYFTKKELMNRWGWGSSKTVSFISQLESWNVIVRPKTDQEIDQKQTAKYRINTSFLALDQTKNRPLNRPKSDRIFEENNSKNRLSEIGVYKRIIDYLNKKCNTSYKHENENTIMLIQERLDEGFLEDDFYVVIDKKADEWIGTKWGQYLRPCTLFRKDKFENYLNQRVIQDNSKGNAYIDTINNRVNIVDTWMEDDSNGKETI